MAKALLRTIFDKTLRSGAAESIQTWALHGSEACLIMSLEGLESQGKIPTF